MLWLFQDGAKTVEELKKQGLTEINRTILQGGYKSPGTSRSATLSRFRLLLSDRAKMLAGRRDRHAESRRSQTVTVPSP